MTNTEIAVEIIEALGLTADSDNTATVVAILDRTVGNRPNDRA